MTTVGELINELSALDKSTKIIITMTKGREFKEARIISIGCFSHNGKDFADIQTRITDEADYEQDLITEIN